MPNLPEDFDSFLSAVTAAKQRETPKPRFWTAPVPASDDFGRAITTAFIDGATIMGPWAMMAPSSFRQFGRGIGTGRGQKYRKQSDGRWLKVEG